MYEWLNK